MTQIPQIIPTANAAAIASYDFFDIAEGTGVVQFLGARVAVDATTANDVYILTTNSSLVSRSSGDDQKEKTDITDDNFSLDFDVTFNLPKIIEGTAILVLPCEASNDLNPTLTVYHYDGSTETEIVSAITMKGCNGSPQYLDDVLKFTIPRTNFAVGETLRVNLTFEQSGTTRIYHSPTGSRSTNYPLSGGTLSVFVPFVIDV